MTIIVFFGYTVHVVMLFNFSIYILSVNIFWKGWAVQQHFVCYDSTTHYNSVQQGLSSGFLVNQSNSTKVIS